MLRRSLPKSVERLASRGGRLQPPLFAAEELSRKRVTRREAVQEPAMVDGESVEAQDDAVIDCIPEHPRLSATASKT